MRIKKRITQKSTPDMIQIGNSSIIDIRGKADIRGFVNSDHTPIIITATTIRQTTKTK